MTNLLATLTIVAITNWTGFIAPNGQEAGIVCKQHIADIQYRGKTNLFILLTEPTKRAVFREPQTVTNSVMIFTNHWTPVIIYTNYFFN